MLVLTPEFYEEIVMRTPAGDIVIRRAEHGKGRRIGIIAPEEVQIWRRPVCSESEPPSPRRKTKGEGHG